MLIQFVRSRIWIAAAAALLTTAAVSAQDAIRPAPPEELPATVAGAETSGDPAAEEDGVARVPQIPAGCGPRSGAPIAGCGPRNCGPAGCTQDSTFGPNGCLSGACQNGLPCLSANGCNFSGEELYGRPLTWGDVGQKLGYWNMECRDTLGIGGGSGGGAVDSWWYQQCYDHQCKNAYRNRVLAAQLNNKFNYFVPSGCGGEGCAPFGKYARVYAAQPDHFDARDGQLYAAPATGVPTAVPLAPNVHYQYNYSWGTPSSRITPLSNYVRPIHY